MINLDSLNDITKNKELFYKCCASKNWAHEMSLGAPYSNQSDLMMKASELWFSLSASDHLEAFQGHPMIGNIESLKEKYQSKAWSENEQSGTHKASDEVLEELALLNQQYLDKFGFIFIVCATGKSAHEMLQLLKARINNSVDDEMRNAAMEQDKITKIRLEKL